MANISATFSGTVVAILPPRDWEMPNDQQPGTTRKGTTRDVMVSLSEDTEPVRVRFPDDQAMNYVRVEQAGWLAKVTFLGAVKGEGHKQHVSVASLTACEPAAKPAGQQRSA